MITVIENNSSDGTQYVVPIRFPSVHFVINKENVGTEYGFNKGIKESIRATYTMLMNDDVELFPETISSMLRTLRRFPEACDVYAHPMYPDGRLQSVKLKIVGGLKMVHDVKIRKAKFSDTTACLYYNDVSEKVRFFDEFLFFYNEDLDFAVRIKRKGINFIFDPTITVKHHLNQGRSKGERFVLPHFYEANDYHNRKNYGSLAVFLYFMMVKLKIKRYQKKLKATDSKQYNLLLLDREKLSSIAHNYRKVTLGSRKAD
jgi:GT2 family glycosyltransferase